MKIIWTEPAVNDLISNYRIQEDLILVLAVIHGKRDIRNLDLNPWEII
jgi:hypothetical protein